MMITNGEDLRAERLRRGLSQARLAELAGMSHSSRHIYKIEKGDVAPGLATALRLSRALLRVEPSGAGNRRSRCHIAAVPQ